MAYRFTTNPNYDKESVIKRGRQEAIVKAEEDAKRKQKESQHIEYLSNMYLDKLQEMLDSRQYTIVNRGMFGSETIRIVMGCAHCGLTGLERRAFQVFVQKAKRIASKWNIREFVDGYDNGSWPKCDYGVIITGRKIDETFHEL